MSSFSPLYLTFDAVFFFIESLSFPPITGADDSDGFAAIGETDHQNPARCATNAKQSRFLATVSFINRDQMLWVVEDGCRFGEIDAVLRNVRFFLLGIPFKSHPLHFGAIWDNVNIKLQYNFVGSSSPTTHYSSLSSSFPDVTM